MDSTINIDLKRPQINFSVEGTVYATFDMFELDEVISEAGKDTQKIKDWMCSKGVPQTMPLIIIDAWLVQYFRHMSAEIKKENGPLS